MKIKPCPFCGSNDVTLGTNYIQCDDCSANIADDNASQEDLVADWNRRSEREE